MLDVEIDRQSSAEGRKRRDWVPVAVASIIAAPVGLYTVAILLLLVASGWAESNLDASNLVPLLVGGLLGGVAVGLFSRLRGYSLSFPAILGALVGLGFYYLVFDNTGMDMSDEAKIFTIYVPVQTLTYFLASWLPSRK